MLMKTFLSLSQDDQPPSDSASRQNSSRLKTCEIQQSELQNVKYFTQRKHWNDLRMSENGDVTDQRLVNV